MFKLNLKKYILTTLFSAVLLMSIVANNVHANPVDCRFVSNKEFKSEITRYIYEKKLNALFYGCRVSFSDTIIDWEKMIFIISPSDVTQVEIGVPVEYKSNSRIFGDVRLPVKICKRESMSKLVDFFALGNCNLTYQINETKSVYATIGSDAILYQSTLDLNGLNRKNIPQKLCLYKENEDIIGLLQLLYSGETYRYDLSELPIVKL